MNHETGLFRWVVALPLVIGAVLFLGSLLPISSMSAALLKSIAGVFLGVGLLIFVATTWLNRAPLNWQGGLDPKARPVRYHVGMFCFTATALALVIGSGLMLRAAIFAAR